MIKDAHRCEVARDGMTIGRVAVADQVLRRLAPGKGFGDLASDPFRRRIGRQRERYQPPTLVPEDDQDKEQLEADCRHDQEVHGGDACRMVVQERFPGLRPPSPALRHVLGDRRLRDLDAELQQFAVDARRAPKSRLAKLISRIRRRISIGTFGRPPRERDFHRQYRRKPTLCQRMIVSG